MIFLLDTNVLSELRKVSPSPSVLQWFTSISDDHKYVSAITLGEINRGINKLPDGRKRNELISWFDNIQQFFQYQTYTIDTKISLKWGEMTAVMEKKGKRLSTADGLIAATAYIHGAILVTRNTKDFESVPIQILNPWL